MLPTSSRVIFHLWGSSMPTVGALHCLPMDAATWAKMFLWALRAASIHLSTTTAMAISHSPESVLVPHDGPAVSIPPSACMWGTMWKAPWVEHGSLQGAV